MPESHHVALPPPPQKKKIYTSPWSEVFVPFPSLRPLAPISGGSSCCLIPPSFFHSQRLSALQAVHTSACLPVGLSPTPPGFGPERLSCICLAGTRSTTAAVYLWLTACLRVSLPACPPTPPFASWEYRSAARLPISGSNRAPHCLQRSPSICLPSAFPPSHLSTLRSSYSSCGCCFPQQSRLRRSVCLSHPLWCPVAVWQTCAWAVPHTSIRPWSMPSSRSAQQ